MADQVEYPGRLIAVDGSRGKDTAAAARAIVKALRKDGIQCATSQWDASGLFGELAATARGDRNISVRTLSLVFAADLAFRLRWEIRPILAAGGVVVAAPYVDTAIAFGAACGLGDDWLKELMRFAPPADLRCRAEERKVGDAWKRRTDGGYAEYCAKMLDASAPRKLSRRARHEMMRALDQARGGTIFSLARNGAAAIAKSVTDSRLGAPRRSASRPRIGHK